MLIDNLEARVSGRMVLLDISATGEENVIEYDDKKRMNDLEYRRKQLQQLQDNVVDLEDMSGGVSITDLTLNDFKMDLSTFMSEKISELETAPTGLFTVTQIDKDLLDPDSEAGVIFCLKNITGKAVHDESYAIAPYYLVYVTENNTIKYNFLQVKKILDILKKQGLTWHHPDSKAVQFHQSTQQGKDMSLCRSLLETAINSIIGKSVEKGVESLFNRGGTVLTKDIQIIEDFEVISYMNKRSRMIASFTKP